MKIFLTGGSGMVGRNILEHPKAKNHVIIAPSRKELDLLDREAVRSFFRRKAPDLVIHGAGLVGGIQANIENPVEYLSINIDMGFNVINGAASLGVSNLINLGSSCMYPKYGANPLSENLILQGGLEPTNEGYALAKITVARLCEYISRKDPSKNFKTLIPCNLYGRYDDFTPNKSHLIPAVIKKIHDAKVAGKDSVTIWGDGTARREFMTAGDLADFVFFALERLDSLPQNVNVGLGYDYTVEEYYRAVATVVGFSGDFEYDLQRPVGMRQKLVDINHLRDLGWRAKTPLMDGLKQAYHYYGGAVDGV